MTPPQGEGIERVESELLDAESTQAEYEISTYPADFTLEGLSEKLRTGEILIPPFQRKFVWSVAQASRLIESFLLGLPVPPVYLFTEKESEKLLIIDGQQRLRSISYYFEGFFGEETRGRRPVFRLTSLNERSRWAERSYADLEKYDEPSARKLRNQVLRSFIIKQIDPRDDTSIYHIFERLNTGGTTLAGQEIRNCIYHGRFNDLLMELNRNTSWRAIFGRRAPDTRLRDVELILRFLALSESSPSYGKPMKDFLSRFMSRHRNAPSEILKSFADRFAEVAAIVNNELGPKPFHVRAGLNAATFDAVFVALARGATYTPGELRARYRLLIANEDFIKATTSGTTDVETVRARFALASRALVG